jgi:hypothetical protein
MEKAKVYPFTAHVGGLEVQRKNQNSTRKEPGNARMLEQLHWRTGSPVSDQTEHYLHL